MNISVPAPKELISLPLLVDPQVCLLAVHLIGSVERPVRDIRKNLHNWHLIPSATTHRTVLVAVMSADLHYMSAMMQQRQTLSWIKQRDVESAQEVSRPLVLAEG